MHVVRAALPIDLGGDAFPGQRPAVRRDRLQVVVGDVEVFEQGEAPLPASRGVQGPESAAHRGRDPEFLVRAPDQDGGLLEDHPEAVLALGQSLLGGIPFREGLRLRLFRLGEATSVRGLLDMLLHDRGQELRVPWRLHDIGGRAGPHRLEGRLLSVRRDDEDHRRRREAIREESQDLDPGRIAQLATDHDGVETIPHRKLEGLLAGRRGPDQAAAPGEGGHAEDLVLFVSVDHEDGERRFACRPRDRRRSGLGHG